MTGNNPNKKEKISKRNGFSRLVSSLSYKTLILVVIVAVVSIFCTTLISMALFHYGPGVYVPSFATIKTVDVEVYWDPYCENKTDSLGWNLLEVGKTVNQTIYVKSVSNVEISLDINLTDWNPTEISEYLTFSNNYTGQTLEPNDVLPINLSLSASSSNKFIFYLVDNKVHTFNFTLHFVASD